MVQTGKSTDADRSGLAAVERTIRIIEYLADAADGLSISELSRRLDVNKNITFRIVSTLERVGYLYQNRATQYYCLTFKVSNLGLRQLSSSRLVDQCSPILRGLAEQTGEHARLAVIEDSGPIWVHAASGPQRRLVIDPVYASHEVSNHAHAAGKAWLMTLPDDRLDELLKGTLEKFTPYTICSPVKLKAELRKWRRHGFALSIQETELGVSAAAAPIIAQPPRSEPICVGVLSVAAPTSRMDGKALFATGSLVVKTAQKLGENWPLKLENLR